MASQVTESTLEQAELDSFAGLGYEVFYGPEIAPGEPFAERSSYYGQDIRSRHGRRQRARVSRVDQTVFLRAVLFDIPGPVI